MRSLSLIVATCAACIALVAGAASAEAASPWSPFFAAPAQVADFGSAARPFGVARGDFDGDGRADLVVGRTTGNVAFVRGNGDGTFAAPVTFAWKQAFFNAWAFAAGDVNGDGRLDVIWGAAADSPAGAPVVRDGEVRAWLGNGDGTFQQNPYTINAVVHNAGVLLADVGVDAGSLSAADVDGDGDRDVVAGAVSGSQSVVKLLRNDGAGAFAAETVVDQPALVSGDGASPTYFPATLTQNSPWGLALGDADGDGDQDLFVGDRALYVYLFVNDGSGALTLKTGNTELAGRPNVYLRHDSHRAAVGFTPSLAAADLDGDDRADLALGLHSGTQTPASATAHDGKIVVDVTNGGRHRLFGSIADVGTMARGVQIADLTGDGVRDIVAATYEGQVALLRQLPPRDGDGDGVSDYVDNAPEHPNAPRLDMDTDGSITYRDQLDNDFDTVLGDPEDESTWQRRGDAADGDDDNDGVADAEDNCRLIDNGDQANRDSDGRGDACDPLDETDDDADGVPNGPSPEDRLFEESRAASARWSEGDTHFVIRIDALGRLFQNEFTGLMTDAATSSPETWATKCQGMYNGPDPDPGCATLPGGKSLPISLVTIPRLLWTDPEVIDWVNDRNDNPRLELGQHGTYHISNTGLGDWKDLSDRNFFSCELCGFDDAESYELLKVGHDTLLGRYDNGFVRASGATDASPKIDWSSSANPLITYAPPYNASDEPARKGMAHLGFRSFSASVHEEGDGGIGQFFSPEGAFHEKFDPYGVFHASADTELEPPETVGGAYDRAAYQSYLESETNPGGLTTWLIEEVEWSGRPCNELDRLDDLCNGGSNRENNTVHRPRWDGWMQLLDYAKNYPGGVVMTLGEVALARGYDNAMTVANADQADADHDGVGDVIDGAELSVGGGGIVRNVASAVSATLRNGAGDPIADQDVELRIDADGDGTAESYAATTDASGVAKATVTATRPVGPAGLVARWNGGHGVTAEDDDAITVRDGTSLTLAAENSAQGQVTDQVSLSATLRDSDDRALAGHAVTFSIGDASATATTDPDGRASGTLTLAGPAGATTIEVAFAGEDLYGQSSANAPFTVLREDTRLAVTRDTTRGRTTIEARLIEADGAPLARRTLELYALGRRTAHGEWQHVGTAQTDADGSGVLPVPPKHKMDRLRTTFAGDTSFLPITVEDP